MLYPNISPWNSQYIPIIFLFQNGSNISSITTYIYIIAVRCMIYSEKIRNPMITHDWLVVYLPPSEKYEFVSWDDDIPNIWKNKTCSKPPTRYSIYPLVICYSLLLNMAIEIVIFPIKHGDLKPPTSNPWYFHDIPHLSRIFIPCNFTRSLVVGMFAKAGEVEDVPGHVHRRIRDLKGNKKWKDMADIMVNDG